MDRPKKKDKLTLKDVHNGMLRLDDPQVTDPDVDIILVPGLGTDPVRCWEDDDEKKSTGHVKPKTKFNWVLDNSGLSTIASSKARILCYAFASAWYGNFKAESSFDNIANGLCEGVKAMRQERHEQWRPIIFIGHSMGGLVIAEALNELDRRRDYYGDILPSVTSCFFFGVPFGGSEMARTVLKYGPKVGFFTRLYDDILHIMVPPPANTRLQKLCDDFKQLSARTQPGIEIHCFSELLDMNYGDFIASMPLVAGPVNSIVGFTWGKQKMVTPKSAAGILEHRHGAVPLNKDHRGLVRFKAKGDDSYDCVRKRLEVCIKAAQSLAKRRQGASRQASMSQVHLSDLTRRLRSSVSQKLDSTPRKIDKQSWFLQDDAYKRWEDISPRARGLSCLWLTGKPGVGRTSIALSAIARTHSMARDGSKSEHRRPLFAFFMCDSTPLGSRPDELLKALLLQLIEQNHLTADHAKSFAQGSEKDSDNDTNATMSIYNLWNCLKNILEDENFENVYIIINNIHLLAPGQETTLFIDNIRDHFESSKQDGREARRWLFTCVDENDPDRFGKLMDAGPGEVVDLSADKYKEQVSHSLENHAMAQVKKLRQAKKYSRDQVFIIQDLMKNLAANTQWIDIQYIRLKALSDGASTEAIREILSPATAINLRLLKRDCWQTIFADEPKDSHALKDLLGALALALRPPTFEELAVLSGIEDRVKLSRLVEKCKPLVQMVSPVNSTKLVFEFSNPSLGEDFLWESNAGIEAKKDGNPPIQHLHGVLAWRCFSFMEATQDMTSSVVPAVSGDPQDAASTEATTIDYPWENWVKHALRGNSKLAEDLVEELPDFWHETSPLREKWLASHPPGKPSSQELMSHDGMTALHAAAAFGYDHLVKQLITHGHREELGMFNGNGYTPLHIAAMCKHYSTIKLILGAMKDISIDIGMEKTGTALHAVATQGHVDTMQLLLDEGADPNAFCTEHGPVINAAIRSGNNAAVQLLLHHERHRLDSHRALAMPPLALAAALSEKEIFKEILTGGKEKWTRDDYRKALDKACFIARKDSVDVLLNAAREYLNDDTLRECMLVAAVANNWSCVDMISRAQPGLARGDIFYLAAVTKREGKLADKVLKEIWNTAEASIPKNVLNAALYQAADNEKYDTVRWLLETCGAEPNMALDRYREQGILPAVCLKNDPDQRYGNALTAAAWDGSNLMVETLIGFGADVDTDEGCALQMAAQEGRADVVRTLLNAGANINRIPTEEPNYRGPAFLDGSAIHAACRSGHTEVVRILLENKPPANPNLGRGQYQRPILAATKLNRPEILEMLLKAGVDVKVCGTGDVSTPLINAAFGMSVDAAKSLIKAKADVNQVDSNRDTAIILASKKGKVDTLRLLIDNKADILYENPRGKSALTMAAKHGHVECFQILADAVAPLFRALKTVSQENSTMRALLAKPDGEHKFYDDETIRPLKAELHQAVETVRRTEEIRAERRAMEAAVASARKETAAHKQEMESLRKDWHEYRERTDQHQKNYEVSIEGFSSAKTKRDELQRELEVAKSELARSRSECAAARAAIEETRRNADEQRRQFEKAQGLDRAVIEAQEKNLRTLREDNNQLKGELEMRTSRSESDSFGTPELNERPRLAGSKKEGSGRVSGLFRRNNGGQGG
ncbi:ankyrin repeat-containing domain protein [Plectosphaerella cucumerina]|uniref:Ankyrin repeat-containing domain protein n=1 Tax=Plectosphaerella cucumerina TaxID=40658 RepID=A0A8K0TEX4_9PEZI|nr:ankyrin repeat-containing domain protein [Plectosphaerella cucumerina]